MDSLQHGFEWPTTTEELITQLGGFIGDVVAFVVVYLVGKYVLVRVVRGSIRARGFDETVEQLATKTAAPVALFVAISVAFTVAGFGSFLAAFATLGGAFALALGFAAQDLIGNFVAGVFILKDKPFEVGLDRVERRGRGRPRNRPPRYASRDVQQRVGDGSELRLGQQPGYEPDGERQVTDAVHVRHRVRRHRRSRRHHRRGRGKFKEVLSAHVQGVKERFDAAGVEMPYPTES